MIEVANLTVRYGQTRAVNDLSLAIAPGESVLLAGANGAGKTTLLRALAGVIRPSRGEIRFAGRKAATRSRRKIAYIPASVSLYEGLTVAEAQRLHRRHFGQAGAVAELGEMPFSAHQKILSLSKGQKTLFALSLALSAAPDLLLIDDVIHFLDPHLREIFLTSILRLIGERQLTVIMASQSAFEIEGIPERVIILNQGALTLNEPVENLKQKFVKFYSEKIPAGLPVVFAREWQGEKEVYIYPYQADIHRLTKVEHLNLSEILRAFIGGEYDRH